MKEKDHQEGGDDGENSITYKELFLDLSGELAKFYEKNMEQFGEAHRLLFGHTYEDGSKDAREEEGLGEKKKRVFRKKYRTLIGIKNIEFPWAV